MNENIKALNSFVLKQLTTEISEFSDDRKALDAQRVKLAKEITESKKAYASKVNKHLSLMNDFILKKLNEEITEFTQDRRLLQEQRVKMAKQLKEARLGYKKQLHERIKALEGFVLRQLTNEMKEFNEDRKALVESRVKLVTEGKKKLSEARATFIKQAANRVDNLIENTLKTEMSQFKDDLKAARENNFGRRIFETFAAEYMASYLSEGTEIKKLQREVANRDQKLTEAKQLIKKHQTVLTEAKVRITKAEDTAKRTKVLNECLKNLARDKRVVMEELLQNVATDKVEDAFKKYLPSVLGEADTRLNQDGRKKLAENNIPARRTVAVTGNRNNRLAETAQPAEKNELATEAELVYMKKMAGI